jgi:hypothetical protein
MIRCSPDIVVKVGNSEEYSVSTLRYAVPECIRAHCDQVKYFRWLHRKAAAHARRDRKRDIACTIARYKAEIHAAVCSCGHLDFYTGEPLDWSLVSTYDNESSRTGRTRYKKTLALLPTIDHTVDGEDRPKFVICSWYVNDAKSDLCIEDFYRLCERVLKYRDERKS